jgi:ABC-type glycerol-3-phosphate transport system substrate-binding protein
MNTISKSKNRKNFLALLIALALTACLSGSTAAQVKKKPVLKKKAAVVKKVAPKPAIKYYTLPVGETLHVRMDQTLSSKTARIGDTFTTTVIDPVYSSTGVVVIPQGSKIVGRVDQVKPAAKGGKPGEIDVTFVEIKLPNGTRKVINGSLTDLDTKKGKSDSEGTVSGDKMGHRKIIFTGGGGVGGAVLGGAIGGGKGAIIGGIAGAIGGYIAENQTKGENVEVKPGTEFGVYLNKSVALPKFAETDN